MYTSSFLLINFLGVICFCFIQSSFSPFKKTFRLKIAYVCYIFFRKVGIKIRVNEDFERHSALCLQWPSPLLSLPTPHQQTLGSIWLYSVFAKAWPKNNLRDSYYEAFTISLGRLQSPLGFLISLLCEFLSFIFLQEGMYFIFLN